MTPRHYYGRGFQPADEQADFEKKKHGKISVNLFLSPVVPFAMETRYTVHYTALFIQRSYPVRTLLAVAITAALCLCACGDENSDNPNLQQVDQSIDENTVLPEGIYEVQRQTENLDSCESEGETDFNGSRFIAAVGVERVGWWTLRLVPCDSLEECRAQMDEMLVDESVAMNDGYDFGEVAMDGFFDKIYHPAVAPNDAGDCAGGKRVERTLVVQSETLQMTVLETPAQIYPANENGSCFTDEVVAATSAQTCTYRMDFELSKVE